jgi:hypothetical protein
MWPKLEPIILLLKRFFILNRTFNSLRNIFEIKMNLSKYIYNVPMAAESKFLLV